jgi:hypothetical protein
LIHFGVVHHRPEIVDTLVQAKKPAHPIRHACTTLVEDRDPGVARDAEQPTGKLRLLPEDFDV